MDTGHPGDRHQPELTRSGPKYPIIERIPVTRVSHRFPKPVRASVRESGRGIESVRDVNANQVHLTISRPPDFTNVGPVTRHSSLGFGLVTGRWCSGPSSFCSKVVPPSSLHAGERVNASVRPALNINLGQKLAFYPPLAYNDFRRITAVYPCHRGAHG